MTDPVAGDARLTDETATTFLTPPESRPVTWWSGPVRRFKAATAPFSSFPLGVLFFLYFADEFDTAAFNTLAPEIKESFGLSDRGFGTLVGINFLLIVLLAVPLGWWADRAHRVRLVVASALVAATFSVGTGLASAVWILVLARVGNGLGLLANDPVHTSLLSDYYTPDSRPQVFAIHRAAARLGAVAGPVTAGLIAFALGWRAAFFIMAVPIFIVTLFTLRLKEPVRGATDSPDEALEAALDDPVSFARGARILTNVPTLRRQFFSSVFLGGAIFPLAALFPLYLDRTFHVGQFGRGVIGTLSAVGSFVGVLWAGRMTRERWLPRGLGTPQQWGGRVIIISGILILLVAMAPTLWMAVAIGVALSTVVSMYIPPILTTTAMVAPARVRSQAFTFFLLFLAIGAINLPIAGAISDAHGLRWALASLAPFWALAGVVISSASKFVARDTERALQNLSTTVALRHERLAAGDRSLLVCRSVDVSYGQTQVLFGVNFDVREGEVVALLGTNGAGKSTLLKAISGSVTPHGGAVFYNGHDFTVTSADRSAAAGIVLVPGGKGVFPTLSVAENFTLAGWLLRNDPAYLADATEEVLGYFPVLRERWDQKAGNLSGGEQQMVTVGMALLARPRLLMIDELSLGLAPRVVEQLLGVVRQISARGVTVILVEQSVNVALTLAERAVFMEKGEVRFDGPTEDLLKRPDVLRSVFLEGAATAMGAPRQGPPAATASRERPTTSAPGPDSNEREEVLGVEGLAVSFGGIKAVAGVDLTVRAGEVVGLIGPNGAGKTTIFDLISGHLLPEAGSVVLGGVDVTNKSPDWRARARLGRSFQDARLFPSMTVRETITVFLERHLDTRGSLAALFMSPATRDTEEWAEAEANRLIELMSLSAFADKFVSELSTGSRRIVDLACCLAHDPKVLLLDEPSSGIAQRETEALGPLLLDIRDKTGAALLVIEHDMPLITGISDEIVALDLGRVIARGRPDDVLNTPQVVDAYLGATAATIHRSGEVPTPAG